MLSVCLESGLQNHSLNEPVTHKKPSRDGCMRWTMDLFMQDVTLKVPYSARYLTDWSLRAFSPLWGHASVPGDSSQD